MRMPFLFFTLWRKMKPIRLLAVIVNKMTKKPSLPDFSYDLDAMTPAQERQFWNEFARMLHQVTDSVVSFSPSDAVTIVLPHASQQVSDIILH